MLEVIQMWNSQEKDKNKEYKKRWEKERKTLSMIIWESGEIKEAVFPTNVDP